MPITKPILPTRREMLTHCANGFGALAFTGLFSGRTTPSHHGALQALHHRPRARRVIFLYMDGGPSQVDTFDPKPRLDREHGSPIKMKVPKTQFDNVGDVLKSPWKFHEHGESGIPVSDLLPHIASCADDLCVIRSMTSEFSEHTNANYFLHTGEGQQGWPSMGSWITYGLGTESDKLPGFLVLNGGLIPPGGFDCFHSSFLPATFQGSILKSGKEPIANLARTEATPELQQEKLSLLRQLDGEALKLSDRDRSVEAAIANYELAFRMQRAVPDLMDMRGESEATRQLYGLDAKFEHTRNYGTLCLLARRLIERGVRFIEVTCPKVGGNDRWDQHSNLEKGHQTNALAVDQPVAALLKDLKARGLLDDTLVLWAGEFGRTPMAQGKNGRDHNPHGFSIWMAGGGVKPGHIHGATDEYGYFAVENKVTMHDLHATILHLLGIEHTKLTYRFSGRDMRLTGVKGEVVHDIIA